MIGLWPTLAWFVSLLVLTALFGFIIALMLFFLAFLTFLTLRAREQGETGAAFRKSMPEFALSALRAFWRFRLA